MDDCQPGEYFRQVRKSDPYHYMKVTLEYEDKRLEDDQLQFKHVMMQALTEVFGQIGASEMVDVLKLIKNGEALLRVPSRCFVRLWSALTLFGSYRNQLCAFRVKQVSTSLMGLSCSSRVWDIPQVS